MGQFYEGLSKSLSLYVRQIAWLNTPVDPEKGSKTKPYARLARMRHEKLAVELPENPAPYLVDWLMEIGPTTSNGMGPGPIGWDDLTHWQQNVGIDLDPWEARTLRTLSRDFADQSVRSRDPKCVAPYVKNPHANNDAVAAQFAKMMKIKPS